MKKYLQNRKLVEIKCDNCHIVCQKPLSEYKRNSTLGRKMFCSRSCSVANNSHTRDRSKGNYKWDHLKKYQECDELTPFRYSFRSLKRRYKEIGVTIEDLKSKWESQNGICPYTGFKMQLKTFSKKASINKMYQASLDRIDSSKGYTLENIEWVCCPINYLKSDFNKNDVLEFLTKFKDSNFSEDRTISSSN